MAILQPIVDMAEICYQQGVRHVIISPGSRSAPLTLAFVRHGGFQRHVVMDERAGAFIGMGIAQQTGVPVVLICTSGSAAFNFAPAVAEAFFQQIPLIVLTADRPGEWVGQLDGQTIFQNEIYGKHVKRAFNLPGDYTHPDTSWMINRSVNEAFLSAIESPRGPVHINVPLREPFYPAEEEALMKTSSIRVIKKVATKKALIESSWGDLLDQWADASKILIVGGQGNPDPSLVNALSELSEDWYVPVIGDSISNLHRVKGVISYHDSFLPNFNKNDLQPDLLITFGLSLLSKELKNFLRTYSAAIHWHIGEEGQLLADPFKSITQLIPTKPADFFMEILDRLDQEAGFLSEDNHIDTAYQAAWQQQNHRAAQLNANYLLNLSKINDLTSIDLILNSNIESFSLHIGNSMPIRYVNQLGAQENIGGIYCNRGTSGIDGSVSTALGWALASGEQTLLLVGDVAFLYDRNGLLIPNLPANFKIFVINNGGGNIFRMIDGPSKLPELEEFFETNHTHTAERTALDSGIDYQAVRKLVDLPVAIDSLLKTTTCSLLEIFTDPVYNKEVWQGLKAHLRGQS